MEFKRYAVYFTPQGEWARRGAAWLGWDSISGCRVPHPKLDVTGLEQVTRTPRKYGLHGTIMAPFSLADGVSPSALGHSFEQLCARMSSAKVDGLRLSMLHGFAALVPMDDQAPLRELAADVVRGLSPLRAPPSLAELERRRRARLSPAQEHNLTTWGYPYVMDDFNFHITLTERLKQDQSLGVLTALAPYLAPHLPTPFEIADLSLMGEDAEGRFHQISRRTLGG